MNSTDSAIVISHYRIKAGAVDAFSELLSRHWPTLRKLELVTDVEPQYFIGHQEPGTPTLVVEIFEWSGPNAAAVAHTHPEISTIWEQMGQHFAAAGDKPAREHFTVQPLAVRH